jgi:hypothetical protein
MGCASPKLHPVEKLNRRLDILTVKSRLDRPNRASWKAMKTQADGILARDSRIAPCKRVGIVTGGELEGGCGALRPRNDDRKSEKDE